MIADYVALLSPWINPVCLSLVQKKLDRWLIPLVGVSLLVLALTRQTFWVLLAVAAVGAYLLVHRR
jgi:hypothetical protein